MTIIATYDVSEGNGDQVAELLRGYVPRVMTEPGCIAFDVYRGIENRTGSCSWSSTQAKRRSMPTRRRPFRRDRRQQIRPLLANRSVEFLIKQ